MNAGYLKQNWIWIAVLVIAMAAPWAFYNYHTGRQSGFVVSMLSQMGMMSILALSYNMLLGQAGLFSLCHATFFGIGGYATIHFLNRMTQRRRNDEDPAIAVEQATVLMGPALILTALVLACGLAALVFSDLPPLRLFGWLGAFAMLAALAADLLILRPVITFLLRLGRHRAPALKKAKV